MMLVIIKLIIALALVPVIWPACVIGFAFEAVLYRPFMAGREQAGAAISAFFKFMDGIK